VPPIWPGAGYAHLALQTDPLRTVTPAELQSLLDPDARENFSHLLDLTHTVQRDVGLGIPFTMTAARSGLKPLAALMAACRTRHRSCA
jgi:hypothetical protein